ncbi:hypothetical protein VCHENC02_1472, partial [Vibrio harveyi]
LFPSTALGS